MVQETLDGPEYDEWYMKTLMGWGDDEWYREPWIIQETMNG
jgi:hypothetical protein